MLSFSDKRKCKIIKFNGITIKKSDHFSKYTITRTYQSLQVQRIQREDHLAELMMEKTPFRESKKILYLNLIAFHNRC